MVTPVDYRHWDPLLNPEGAEGMMALAESCGSFGTYADEATSEGLGEQLPQRFLPRREIANRGHGDYSGEKSRRRHVNIWFRQIDQRKRQSEEEIQKTDAEERDVAQAQHAPAK